MSECPICKHGSLLPGAVTVTLERGELTLVVKDVPARVCDICGEEFVNEEISVSLLHVAEASAKAGTRIEVRSYAA